MRRGGWKDGEALEMGAKAMHHAHAHAHAHDSHSHASTVRVMISHQCQAQRPVGAAPLALVVSQAH